MWILPLYLHVNEKYGDGDEKKQQILPGSRYCQDNSIDVLFKKTYILSGEATLKSVLSPF